MPVVIGDPGDQFVQVEMGNVMHWPHHKGAVLTDHVKSLSWNERSSEFIEPCPDLAPSVLAHVKALLAI